jgi:chromosome segregation ATPase
MDTTMESTASTIAEPITCRNLEISTTVGRLLAARREHSREALLAFHRTQDTAFQVLQESIGVMDQSDDQILELVKDLTTAALDHVSALSLAVHAEADVRIKTAVEETLRQRQETATLSERLGEVETELIALRVHCDAESDRANAAMSEADRFKREAEEMSERLTTMLTEMKALRSELDLERRQAVTIIGELHQARRASAEAEVSRAEAVAARQSEMSQRLTLESELQDALVRLEATRGEADGIRQKLRAAAALATELISVSDNLDIGSSGPDQSRNPSGGQILQPTMSVAHSADGAHREGDPDEQSGENKGEQSNTSIGSGTFELLVRRLRS